MKKINGWALMLITIIAAGISLSSCSKDQMQASNLSGQWRGNFGMYYTDHYGYEWDADYTIIDFNQTWFSDHGTGRQYDYYTYGPYEYQYFRFNWTIKDGVITLHYPSDPNLDTQIYDYQMTSNYFSGYFGSTRTHFYLEKFADDFGWNRFSGDYCYYYIGGYTYNGYDYDDYYGDYYAKTRAAGSTSPSAVTPLVKNGNRFNEKGKN